MGWGRLVGIVLGRLGAVRLRVAAPSLLVAFRLPGVLG